MSNKSEICQFSEWKIICVGRCTIFEDSTCDLNTIFWHASRDFGRFLVLGLETQWQSLFVHYDPCLQRTCFGIILFTILGRNCEKLGLIRRGQANIIFFRLKSVLVRWTERAVNICFIHPIHRFFLVCTPNRKIWEVDYRVPNSAAVTGFFESQGNSRNHELHDSYSPCRN